MSLIGLLVFIIILCLIFYLVQLLPDPPITAPFKNILLIILILFAILVLLGVVPLGNLRVR